MLTRRSCWLLTRHFDLYQAFFLLFNCTLLIQSIDYPLGIEIIESGALGSGYIRWGAQIEINVLSNIQSSERNKNQMQVWTNWHCNAEFLGRIVEFNRLVFSKSPWFSWTNEKYVPYFPLVFLFLPNLTALSLWAATFNQSNGVKE